MVLMAFLDQVERTGSVPVSTAPDQMPLLARSVNILAIPLSTLVTALKARSASPGQISRFLYALLDYWDADRRFTETTLARQLVTLYGNDLRYVAGLGWLLWDGRHWRADVLGDMQELVKSLGSEWRADAGAIMLTLAHATDDLEYQRIFGRSRRVESLANQCEGVRKIENILKAATSIPGIAMPVDTLDSDPFLLNVRNGTIDLRTGGLCPHRREDYITGVAPVDYDPDAHSPIWDRFLVDVTGGDMDLETYIQRVVGYTLLGKTDEEILIMIHGPGGSGKSTFVEAIRSVLGSLAKTADFASFLKSNNSAIRNDIARLRGARLVTSVEVDEGSELAAAMVKQVTGGDTISARYLYKEPIEFKPSFTLFMVTNDLPEIDGTDSGLDRRIMTVPFVHAVPSEKRDPALKAFLTDPDLAGPAILAWAVAGCLAYQQQEGLGTCEAVEAASREYRESTDAVGRFIEDCCVVGPGEWESSANLYQAYRDWAGNNGELPILVVKALAGRLKKKGMEPAKRGGKRGWSGLSLGRRDPRGQVSNLAALPSGRSPS